MNSRAKMINNAFLSGLIFSLCLSAVCLVLNQPAVAQTAGEAITTMGVQQELMGSEMKQRIKEPNLNMEGNPQQEKVTTKEIVKEPSIDKLEKAAQKLMQSMRSGQYDRENFSAVWSTIIPKETDFNNGINSLLKPTFEQYGKAEKLGEGKMAGVNKAVFPVEFTKGTLNMTVSLDPQDKIVEWTLLPQTAEETAQKELNGSQAEDFNDYKQEISRIDIEARDEESKWLGRLERKADLAKTMNDVAVAELNFLKKLAEAEGAQKSVEAIDLLLKKRQDRLTKLTTKLEEEAKTERRERRTPRQGGVGAGEQGQTTRPQRRTRTPNNAEGQQQ
jgi:hypothetical protein